MAAGPSGRPIHLVARHRRYLGRLEREWVRELRCRARGPGGRSRRTARVPGRRRAAHHRRAPGHRGRHRSSARCRPRRPGVHQLQLPRPGSGRHARLRRLQRGYRRRHDERLLPRRSPLRRAGGVSRDRPGEGCAVLAVPECLRRVRERARSDPHRVRSAVGGHGRFDLRFHRSLVVLLSSCSRRAPDGDDVGRLRPARRGRRLVGPTNTAMGRCR